MERDPQRIIHRREALAAGYTDGELRRARRDGTLHLIRRGAYATPEGLAGADAIARHRLLLEATVAASHPNAVVSHVSAAVLHGIDVWGVPLARVHLTIDGQSGGRIVRRRHVHATPLRADEVVTSPEGFVVTSVARTVADIARSATFEQAVVTGDAALHCGLVSLDELRAAADRASSRRGAPRARRVVEFLDERSESVGESRSRVLMLTHQLPEPDLQRAFHDPRGRLIGRVDFFFEGFNAIGEFDGMGKYTRYLRPGESPADALIREKLREDALRAATAAAVARWTWPELSTPNVVVERIRRAFEIGRRR